MALQSGSNGNSIYVEAGGMRFLVDAGISGVQMRDRLATRDVDPRTIDGLLISHDHSDHTRCMGIYHRKYGIPVYVTNPTLMEARRRTRLGIIDDIRTFRPGDCLQFGSVTIETVPTPHDSIESVGFVFDDGQSRVGVLTDLGHIFSRLRDVLCSLDAVLLESNYDPDLLESGPYPEHLKKRVRGPGGRPVELRRGGATGPGVRQRSAMGLFGAPFGTEQSSRTGTHNPPADSWSQPSGDGRQSVCSLRNARRRSVNRVWLTAECLHGAV